MKNLSFLFVAIVFFAFPVSGQDSDVADSVKVKEVIAKAIKKLGGEKYRNVSSVSSSGKLSVLKESRIASYQSFVDIIVYPDKERTDFSERGTRTVQVNKGDTGWIFDEMFETFGPQTDKQLENFSRGMRTHYDFLLRKRWDGKAEATYEGRRVASLGKRNDVIRLTFEDDFWVEYEFSDKGLPAKTVYPVLNEEKIEIKEENRYARFVLIEGILFPFIVDNYSDGKHSYRINYSKVMFNRPIQDSIFEKPANPKKIKKLKI